MRAQHLNHNHSAFCAQFLYAMKLHMYQWMNLSQCTTLKGCYCKMQLAKEKSNSIHNARNENNNCGRQGTKLEGQNSKEDLVKATSAAIVKAAKILGVKNQDSLTIFVTWRPVKRRGKSEVWVCLGPVHPLFSTLISKNPTARISSRAARPPS